MEAKTEIYNIYFDNHINAVVMEWDGYATSKQFKQGTELMLNMLIQNNCSKVLADIKDMKIIAMEDQQWLNEEFLPRATSFGFKSIAIVKPDFYFNKVAVETISYKADKDKLTINFFDNTDEAKEWLSKI
ncbi:MAG TPA: STAS/SEC14 domain-containing protein [Chitinophagaceae bacterium]|nr:STAS/SEC14 domain-containing protein [Chitinophagaceae bacterium]